MTTPLPTILPSLRTLGLAGLLPQIVAVLVVLAMPDWRWVALAAGWAYAALIFSFLGGMWWAIALVRSELPPRIHALAVAPSLIAFASFLPWTLGWTWPGPSLMILGALLTLSYRVDRWISSVTPLPDGWIVLRTQLSLGLGALTIALAFLAGNP
jgi:hypothetical protein